MRVKFVPANHDMKAVKDLLAKYDVPAPRYTSYPTVPYWDNTPSNQEWLGSINSCIQQGNKSWSLYIHIPYCASLCTYCGCHTTISKKTEKAIPYVDLLLQEFANYLSSCPDLKKVPLKEIHLGGGTPTFLSSELLQKLLEGILASCTLDKQFAGSIEVDPRTTSVDQLQTLYQLGFRRVSLGVQDFDPEVQRLVNRIQPEEQTRAITEAARSLGYQSVNYDLIYGLPSQNIDKIKHTIKRTIAHRPDRIALYSLAIVPWVHPQQRLFSEEDLPQGAEKRQLYEVARDMLLTSGYHEIGMDHFALENDALYQAMIKKQLHRNFMGYADKRTDILLGLGVSAISETPTMFHQNNKKQSLYAKKVLNGDIPTLKGHILTLEDRKFRELILQLMTQWEVSLDDELLKDMEQYLHTAFEDHLIRIDQQKLVVNALGRPFIRNISMALDQRLRRRDPEKQVFSQSI